MTMTTAPTSQTMLGMTRFLSGFLGAGPDHPGPACCSASRSWLAVRRLPGGRRGRNPGGGAATTASACPRGTRESTIPRLKIVRNTLRATMAQEAAGGRPRRGGSGRSRTAAPNDACGRDGRTPGSLRSSAATHAVVRRATSRQLAAASRAARKQPS